MLARKCVSPAPMLFARVKVVGVGVALGVCVMVATAVPALAAVEPTVGLGTAATFGVLAGSTVTNTGPSTIDGLDLGVSPGSAVTGFPPGLVVLPGVEHITDAAALSAQNDAGIAFTDAAGRSASGADSGLTDLVGKTLQPGVYQGDLSLTGTVTLDNSTDPDAVFIFQASSTLITGTDAVVAFTTEHRSCNVFWEVGTSATLGTGTSFTGTILAHDSISAGTGAIVHGRLLADTGAVTLDTNTISAPSCSDSGPTRSSSSSSSPASSSSSSASSSSPASSTSTPATTGSSSSQASSSRTSRTFPSAPLETLSPSIIFPSITVPSTTTATGTHTSLSTNTVTSSSAQVFTTEQTSPTTLTTETAVLGSGGTTTSGTTTLGLASTGVDVTSPLMAGGLAVMLGGVVVWWTARRSRPPHGRHI